MTLFKKFDRHTKLMERMADTVGIDLGETVQSGELTPEMLRNGVFACMGCRQTSECIHWLADNPDGADDTPAYCRNRNLYDMLGSG